MKEKLLRRLMTAGLVAAVILWLAVCVVGVVAELFPAVIPDWVFTASCIISTPLWVVIVVCGCKELFKTRKAKKAKRETERQ